jgi:hypothetical protein
MELSMTNWTDESHNSKSPVSKELSGAILLCANLSADDKDTMFALMASYYQTSRTIFDADLSEKEHVILLRDATDGQICGFSTMCSLHFGETIALFSGDTIVHEDYRNEMLLPRLWAQLAFGTADSIKTQDPHKKVYWFLISSGYKTYRYLPLFFREFYPRYNCPTPTSIQALMDSLASRRYPEEYQPKRGIVRLKNPTPLREGVAEIQSRHLTNPHIAFFARINPNHHEGDELVCLTEIERRNLTSAGQRMVGR